jgi:hypothetical protein
MDNISAMVVHLQIAQALERALGRPLTKIEDTEVKKLVYFPQRNFEVTFFLADNIQTKQYFTHVTEFRNFARSLNKFEKFSVTEEV